MSIDATDLLKHKQAKLQRRSLGKMKRTLSRDLEQQLAAIVNEHAEAMVGVLLQGGALRVNVDVAVPEGPAETHAPVENPYADGGPEGTLPLFGPDGQPITKAALTLVP